jgi:PAS domain S-box-containing protein
VFTIRLLIVDDEPVILIVTKTFLEKDNANIECDTCSSAREALIKLTSSSYDAIVSDYDMPEMDGIALLKEVRSRYDELPFILLTGRGREEVVIEALNHGADFYLEKSAEPRALYAELASKIRYAVDRQRGREALRKSEEKARAQLAEIDAIYASAPVGLCLLGTDTRYLRVNELFAEMNGFSVEEHLGKRVRELVPDLADAAEGLARTVVETGEAVLDIEIKGETPAQPGFQHYWKESWVPLKDALGRVRAINIVAEDITESKRAENALQVSEKKYRQLFESMGEGFVLHELIYDERGRPIDYLILEINPAYERITGFRREQVVGRGITEVLPHVEPIWFERYDNVVRNGAPMQFDEFNAGFDSWFSINAYPVEGENRFAVTFSDITDRKRAEEELRQKAEMLQRLIDTIPAMIAIFDPNLQQFQFNTALRNILGWTEEDAAKGDFMTKVYPDPAYRAQVSAFMQSLEPGWRDWKATAKDGSIVESSWANISLSDDTLIGIGIDLRERKQVEKALKDASKKLNLLTSITRHDILNQVTALKGFLTLMQDPDCDGGGQMQMFGQLETIADTIRRQITFTGNYQDMGERKPEWQQVEWVVTQAAKSVRLNGTSLTVDTGSLELFADPMLEKVFYNLLDNAVFHGGSVENIRISFRENNGSGVLVVEDDGVGVPAAKKKEIFDRGVGKVTGYGLFLAKEILDITCMSIRESGEEGSGARFEIEVPAGKWRIAEN